MTYRLKMILLDLIKYKRDKLKIKKFNKVVVVSTQISI